MKSLGAPHRRLLTVASVVNQPRALQDSRFFVIAHVGHVPLTPLADEVFNFHVRIGTSPIQTGALIEPLQVEVYTGFSVCQVFLRKFSRNPQLPYQYLQVLLEKKEELISTMYYL